jgi:RNA polymerase sigma-70 factor (family 1)
MPEKEIYDERTLLRDIVSGDESAYKRLYFGYRDEIYRLVLRYVKSHELAQDISQDIFMKVWEKREKLAAVEYWRAYLLNLAKNHTLNILRTAGRSEAALGEILRHFEDKPGFFDDETLSRDYRDFIKRTFDSLSPRAQEIFMLCREQGKTYDEVAAALGITRSAVRKHMVQSLKRFRDAAQSELGVSLGIILPFLPLLSQASEVHK